MRFGKKEIIGAAFAGMEAFTPGTVSAEAVQKYVTENGQSQIEQLVADGLSEESARRMCMNRMEFPEKMCMKDDSIQTEREKEFNAAQEKVTPLPAEVQNAINEHLYNKGTELELDKKYDLSIRRIVVPGANGVVYTLENQWAQKDGRLGALEMTQLWVRKPGEERAKRAYSDGGEVTFFDYPKAGGDGAIVKIETGEPDGIVDFATTPEIDEAEAKVGRELTGIETYTAALPRAHAEYTAAIEEIVERLKIKTE
ncbi:MAG: hypothetical protein WC817_03470 [Patescibacteria group bacterium]|jgi:hypothetical protein